MDRGANNGSPWASLGVAESGEVAGFLVNRAANALIAVLSVPAGRSRQMWCERLYFRSFQATTYRRVEPSNALESLRDARSCSEAPFVVFMSTTYRENPDSHSWVAESSALCRLDLRTGERVPVLMDEDIIVEKPYKRAYLRQLVDVRPDGGGAVLAMGLERESAGGRTIDPGIFELTFETRAIIKLTALSQMVL
jgi:hypothetical protein